MKIALVSPYDFVYPGGVTNHITSLGHHLALMGHDVRVIAPASKTVTTLGDILIPVGKPLPIPTSGSIARITISPRLRPNIKDLLAEEKFDIIHLHEPLMPMLCPIVLRDSQTVNVGTFHAFDGKPGYNFLKPLSTLILGKIASKLDGRIAVSKPAMEFVNRYFPGNYDIIPNGVEIEHFSPDVAPIDELSDGKLNILFVGRLEKRKGADYLLKAYQRIKRDLPNSRLIIVGPGTRLRSKYERQVEQSDLKDVIFVGYINYNELPRYYKTADIFCAPATGWESFGIVLLEAMAAGKPVVASNIDGYASILTDGVEGLLVPPKDDAKLAQALTSLMADSSLRQKMGANGVRKAAEYDWKHIAQRVLDYYGKVLAGSPQRVTFSVRQEIKERLCSLSFRKIRFNGKANPSS
jgi:phosphatidylinositol alpha-mannosyltransferase